MPLYLTKNVLDFHGYNVTVLWIQTILQEPVLLLYTFIYNTNMDTENMFCTIMHYPRAIYALVRSILLKIWNHGVDYDNSRLLTRKYQKFILHPLPFRMYGIELAKFNLEFIMFFESNRTEYWDDEIPTLDRRMQKHQAKGVQWNTQVGRSIWCFPFTRNIVIC